MILRFFAVEAVTHAREAVRVQLGQLFEGGGGQRDAFVAGSEQHVDGERGVGDEIEDGAGVGGRDGAEEVGAVEEAGVEEVGRLAAGFQGILAESEDFCGQAGLEEGGFVRGGI